MNTLAKHLVTLCIMALPALPSVAHADSDQYHSHRYPQHSPHAPAYGHTAPQAPAYGYNPPQAPAYGHGWHSGYPSRMHDNIDQRQQRQRARIEAGVRNGQITPREAEHLYRIEARLDAEQQRAWSDGVLTGYELRRLQREADRASNKIWEKTNNRHQRW